MGNFIRCLAKMGLSRWRELGVMHIPFFYELGLGKNETTPVCCNLLSVYSEHVPAITEGCLAYIKVANSLIPYPALPWTDCVSHIRTGNGSVLEVLGQQAWYALAPK